MSMLCHRFSNERWGGGGGGGAMNHLPLLFCKCVYYSPRIFINDLIDSNQVIKARGTLVLQMQGLSFLGKLDFTFLHKNGC